MTSSLRPALQKSAARPTFNEYVADSAHMSALRREDAALSRRTRTLLSPILAATALMGLGISLVAVAFGGSWAPVLVALVLSVGLSLRARFSLSAQAAALPRQRTVQAELRSASKALRVRIAAETCEYYGVSGLTGDDVSLELGTTSPVTLQRSGSRVTVQAGFVLPNRPFVLTLNGSELRPAA